MAKSNSIASKTSATKARPKVSLRASERDGPIGFKLDVRAFALRNLMTEQCRCKGGWATVQFEEKQKFAALLAQRDSKFQTFLNRVT